jgi:hypothetical protein
MKPVIIVFVIILYLIIMPTFAFSDVIKNITYGYNAIPPEGIIVMCVGISLYLFGCNLKWKLNNK